MLVLFGFFLLYYLFCDIFSDMLTCLFYIMLGFFLTIKITKNTIN